ncbi:MAG: DNA polymerase III subunit beta, partial [Hyphomonadaceae bacterium]|nr:DNA polymerase III subunit beta [Clostridia bacterium]
MKLVCETAVLREAINIVQKAVSTRSTSPILGGILLEATENLKLTANDMDIAIACQIDADVVQMGAIVLDHKIFSEIVRSLPEQHVTIFVNNDLNTIITSGLSEFKIMGMHVDEFPELPEVLKQQGIQLSQMSLKTMIKQTLFATSTNENRLILTGSCFEIGDGFIKIISVDGFRLAFRKEVIPYKDKPLKFV